MNYLVKRVGQAVLTFVAAVTLAFILFRVMPGNPVDAFIAQRIDQCVTERPPVGSCSEADRELIRQQAESRFDIDPDKPVLEAYKDFAVDIVVHQDFGSSYSQREPVFALLFRVMPWSVFISIYGLLLGFTTSIFLGSLMAYKEGSYLDYGLTLFDQFMSAVPYYVAAIFAISIFAYGLGWFPTGGRANPDTAPGFNLPFMLGVVHHAALPVLTGFVLGFGGSLKMRANAISVVGSDYMRSARLRGIGTSRIALLYVTRNAVLPMYTGFMIGIAGIFSSGIITEQIFTYPAVGWYTFQAFEFRDYPLLIGSFIFFTGLTILGILFADLTYGLIDPRVSVGGDES
jgi:peptide/nickel transport system permease protein